MSLEVKAAYTVPELGRLLGVHRHRAARVLARMGVVVQPGSPRLVLLADLKASAPDLWASIVDAAHLRGLAAR